MVDFNWFSNVVCLVNLEWKSVLNELEYNGKIYW